MRSILESNRRQANRLDLHVFVSIGLARQQALSEHRQEQHAPTDVERDQAPLQDGSIRVSEQELVEPVADYRNAAADQKQPPEPRVARDVASFIESIIDFSPLDRHRLR